MPRGEFRIKRKKKPCKNTAGVAVKTSAYRKQCGKRGQRKRQMQEYYAWPGKPAQQTVAKV